jgi:translocation and assembly module TamB
LIGRSLWRTGFWALALGLVFTGLLIGGLRLIQSEALVRVLAEQAVQRSDGRLALSGVAGTLSHGVRLAQLSWQQAGQRIEAEGLSVTLSWRALARGRLVIEAVRAERLNWTTGQTTDPSSSLPASLAPALDLSIERLRIERMMVQGPGGASPWVGGPFEARVAHEQGVWALSGATLAGLNQSGQAPWIGEAGLLGALDGSLSLHSQAPFALTARLSAIPRLSDPRWQRLNSALELDPQRPLSLAVRGTLERLTVAVALPGQRAEILASGQWRPLHPGASVPWELRVQNLDPARWQRAWPAGQWSGRIVSDGSWPASGQLELTNAQPGPVDAHRWPISGLAGRWRWDDTQLQLDELRWDGPAGPGRATARIDLRALRVPQSVALPPASKSSAATGVSGPAVFAELSLNASSEAFDLRGVSARWPATSLRGQLQLASDARGWHIVTQWQDPAREAELQAQLRLEPDRLTLDRATLTGRAGQARFSGRLSGVNPQDMASATWQLEGRFEGLEPSRWLATLPPGAVQGPFAVSGQGRDLQSVRTLVQWGPARIALEGVLRAQTDRLDLRIGDLPLEWMVPGQPGRLAARVQVQLPSALLPIPAAPADSPALSASRGPSWQGRLLQADLEGLAAGWRVNLRSPMDWRWTGADLLTGPARWTLSPGGGPALSVLLREARWGESGTVVQLRMPEIPIASFDRWLAGRGLALEGPEAPVFSLEAELQAPASARPEQWRGQLTLTRDRGDLRIQAGPQGPWIAAGLQTASLSLQLGSSDLLARWEISGSTLGRSSGQLRAAGALGSGGLNRLAPLQGEARFELPTLAFARAWMGEAWLLDGVLQADVRVAGTLTAPRWTGTVVGRELVARQRELGMVLREGEMTARLIEDRAEIDRLTFRSGDGRVSMSGVLRADARSEAQLTLERFPVPLGPGQRLVLSGQAQARLERGELQWRGAVRADEGVIEITTASTPRLSGDVRVRGAGSIPPIAANAANVATSGAGRASAEPLAGFQVISDLQIDLGERLRVFGSGLDARLTGSLRLSGRIPEAPLLHGTVRTRSGTYRGLGQELQIERGTLVFSGDIEDPAIDLVAWRRFQPVEAGVSLAGTARRPVLTLVSRPDVPDPDKLSWLVLGTAFDTGRGGQNAALQAAAAVLVTGADARSPLRGLVSSLGLDLLSVRTSTVGAGEASSSGSFAQDSIVTLGKRLTERIFLSYEQSLRGLQNLFRLQYQISERLTVRARAGSEQAIDLIWSRRYD